MNQPKTKYPRRDAVRVAHEVVFRMKPACERIIVAGSLRRMRDRIGDVEVLFIPKRERRAAQDDFFASVDFDLAEAAIGRMVADGVLARRPLANGRTAFGPKNKLMLHCRSGIPVDLFSATEANWHNYLVCRTGPAESNMRIAAAAQARGWTWNPYGEGFSNGSESVRMGSEEAVFAFVGLRCLPPRER